MYLDSAGVLLMAEKTGIAWTDHTFNIAWGCVRVSLGCKNCYAEMLSKRLGGDVWGPGKPRRLFGDKHWAEPLKWNRRAEKNGKRERVFTSSMCDIYEDHPEIKEARGQLWHLIGETPWLDWQLLTKRPEEAVQIMGLPDNVWFGVSVESNEYAHRIDALRKIPAAVRFISYEPALGPLVDVNLEGIHWVIYGGESGKGFRPDNPRWASDMEWWCKENGVAFFYKQHAGPKSGMTDGIVTREWPHPSLELI